MNTLSLDLEYEILSYIMTCNSNVKYVVNKLSYKYYKKNAYHRFCAPIRLFNRDFCNICYAKEIEFIKLMNQPYYPPPRGQPSWYYQSYYSPYTVQSPTTYEN
jgi:hypothetical protein